MSHTIFVGLSGGVDSAVSAALLKEEGYDVVGVFIKIWQPEFLECTWKEERLDAMRVCATLGIPFREVDLSDEYQKEVVERMIHDYQSGITPNPDVLCNRHIKFGSFLAWARREGADRVATGHYAQTREVDGHVELLRARDYSKDQSYFLHSVGQEDLAKALFPIGTMLKSEVRALAQDFHLPVAEKPDSQGLCFVGEVSMSEFLKRFIPVVPGPVLSNHTVVGEHEGAALYTIGQRHGFSIAEHASATPHYVTGIDIATNSIEVSPRRMDAARSSVSLRNPRWVYEEPETPAHLYAQARYHEEGVAVELTRSGAELQATFASPHLVSRGQSLVLYAGAEGRGEDVCLGGGIIHF